MRKLGPGGRAFQESIASPAQALPDGAMDYYWHPQRDGVEQAPDDFQRELALISTDVRVVRPPAGAPLYYTRAWLVWYRKPSVTHPLSPGWLMLRDWRDSAGEPLALDARVFSFLYSVSARVFGNGRKYWDHCVEEMKRDRAAKEKIHRDGNHDRTEDYRRFMQVKNIGAGNKFSLHHDGTVVPSRGQANWLHERRKRMRPADMEAAC